MRSWQVGHGGLAPQFAGEAALAVQHRGQDAAVLVGGLDDDRAGAVAEQHGHVAARGR